jgi:hypothetical protein
MRDEVAIALQVSAFDKNVKQNNIKQLCFTSGCFIKKCKARRCKARVLYIFIGEKICKAEEGMVRELKIFGEEGLDGYRTNLENE